MHGNWLSLRLPIGYLDRRNSEFNVFVLNLVHSTLVVELDRPGPFRPVLDPVFTVISHHTEEATPSLPDMTKNRENMESTFEFFTPADRRVAGGGIAFDSKGALGILTSESRASTAIPHEEMALCELWGLRREGPLEQPVLPAFSFFQANQRNSLSVNFGIQPAAEEGSKALLVFRPGE